MLDIIADHFLYHMVRSIVGTALAVHDEPDPGQAMAATAARAAAIRSGHHRAAHGTLPGGGVLSQGSGRMKRTPDGRSAP
jgi:tRNA U38,U39,U40 pseudouridine synthase TruA